MEAIDYESVISPGSIEQSPISLTTTEVNITGSWKIFKPLLEKGIAPCLVKCPLKIKIPEYIYEMAKKNEEKALNLLREYNPIPAILGRVCPHFCMNGCNRSVIDAPLHTGYIEQYLGDIGLDLPYLKPQLMANSHVAVIGSGPAGIGAAYFLSKYGVKVTIYEKEGKAGGLLRYGIPSYRLPKDILDAELENLFKSLQINVVLNQEIKKDDLSHLMKDHKMIFFAPGLNESIFPLNLEREKRVLKGLELLNMINKGHSVQGKSFAVIGGGNVAVDVARSLLRLGKKVEVLYRRTYKEMPAYEEEKAQMLKEGVVLRERTLVGEVKEKETSLTIVLHKAVNDNGKIVTGDPYCKIQADYLVVAIGQKKGISVEENESLFIGGDYLIGASSVAESVATGKEGAIKILNVLKEGKIDVPNDDASKCKVITPENVHFDYIKKSEPIKLQEISIDKRLKSFISVYPPVNKTIIEPEVERCLSCGICNGCGLCWFFCPDNAIILEPEGSNFKVKILLEHCKGCGICSNVCPRGVINMEEDK